MYNIKQAAARAGVSVPVLRAWERRYGIVEPPRTPSGYRQFDDAAVARIRAMRELVEAGWAPSNAAAAIRSGEVPISEVTSDARPQSDDAPTDVPAEAVRDRFVAAAGALDPAALERVLDDTFARGSFERVASDALFPALRALGDAWASGEVSVAGEHLASAAVQRRLGLALDAAGRPAGAGPHGGAAPVIVALPPGGRHELGALAFAVAASRAGLPVSYLGPDLPVDDWLRAASNAAAVVIGMVTSRDRTAALDVARRLRAAEPGLVIALGGPSASVPDDLDATLLPPSLPDGVDALADAISQREGRALA
jgi:DNA-binding transcriptional MerR regulator/methylmalonyl-CoA mutase cobalamin-binding subunit